MSFNLCTNMAGNSSFAENPVTYSSYACIYLSGQNLHMDETMH